MLCFYHLDLGGYFEVFVVFVFVWEVRVGIGIGVGTRCWRVSYLVRVGEGFFGIGRGWSFCL